jgi:hypothetical protein
MFLTIFDHFYMILVIFDPQTYVPDPYRGLVN